MTEMNYAIGIVLFWLKPVFEHDIYYFGAWWFDKNELHLLFMEMEKIIIYQYCGVLYKITH